MVGGSRGRAWRAGEPRKAAGERGILTESMGRGSPGVGTDRLGMAVRGRGGAWDGV